MRGPNGLTGLALVATAAALGAAVSTMAFDDQACGLGASGTATVLLGSGSYFFVVVGNGRLRRGFVRT